MHAPSGEEQREALAHGCGLIDRSEERGRLALTGADAAEFLNGQVTNEIAGLRGGEGRYAAFLTHKGKMLGDLRVIAVGDGGAEPRELLLDTERPALQALFDMIRRFKVGYRIELHKRTLEMGELSLLGPGAARTAGAEALPAQEHANVAVELEGVPALAVRTDLGVDLFCESADAGRLAQALRSRGAVPVEAVAAETLRIERGRPRWALELDETVIPQEAGLNERAVSFTKGCYVGQETVARLFYKGKPNRHLRGLRLSAPADHGQQVLLGEREVGTVGSAGLSPQLGHIALALLRREAEPGAEVLVGPGRAQATVVELPFGAREVRPQSPRG